MIGAGGLGSPALLYLAAAGVGTLTIIDDDVVSLSNLQRQVIHATAEVGQEKAYSAVRHIAALNPHVTARPVVRRLDAGNAAALLSGHDVVIDGSDNFETRFLAADTCAELGVPLVAGALNRFDGSLTVLAPFLKDADGRPLPGLRSLFPAAPPEGTVAPCAQAGILGAVAGIIGTMQATETLKLITGAGEPLFGQVVLVDALTMRFETIRYG